MSAHTPGPWRAMDFDHEWRIRTEKTNAGIAVVHTPRSDSEESANATLIAAAPDLVEALRDALPFIDARTTTRDGRNVAEVIGAALAKAGVKP